MDQEELIRSIMTEVMAKLAAAQGAPATTATTSPPRQRSGDDGRTNVTAADYPLSERAPDRITTSTGKPFAQLTLDNVKSGQLQPDDVRISADTLAMQAQVADAVGRSTLARNLRRAAELIAVPDDELLTIYNALRPYRSTKEELYGIADNLESRYSCTLNATFVREAADVYERRGRLKRAE